MSCCKVGVDWLVSVVNNPTYVMSRRDQIRSDQPRTYIGNCYLSVPHGIASLISVFLTDQISRRHASYTYVTKRHSTLPKSCSGEPRTIEEEEVVVVSRPMQAMPLLQATTLLLLSVCDLDSRRPFGLHGFIRSFIREAG